MNTLAETSDTPQRRSKLSIVGFIFGIVALALLFVPTVGPILAFPFAGIGVILCGISLRKNKESKSKLTQIGAVLNFVLFIVAIIMSFNIESNSAESNFISKPSECYELENMIRTGNENGLSQSDIEGHLRRIFGGQAEVDRVKDLCTDYYKRKYSN